MDTFARVDDLVCETGDIFMGRVWVIVWVSICVFLSEPPSHNSLCLVNSVRWSPGIDESMKQYVQIQRQTSCLKRFSVISARANARLVGVAIGLIKFLIWICYTIGRCIVCTHCLWWLIYFVDRLQYPDFRWTSSKLPKAYSHSNTFNVTPLRLKCWKIARIIKAIFKRRIRIVFELNFSPAQPARLISAIIFFMYHVTGRIEIGELYNFK